MLLEELIEMSGHYEKADLYIREAIVRGRFELRLTMLQVRPTSAQPVRPSMLWACLEGRAAG